MIFLCSVLLASCATTTVNSVWKNEKYTGGPLNKIAILGLGYNPAVRKLFEDEFVRELKARGVDAVPTYPVLLSDELGDRDAAVTKVKSLGTDGVLAARVVDRKTTKIYTPEVYSFPYSYNDFAGYYGYVVSGGQVVQQDEVVSLETNVYDMKTGQLLWTARTDTWLGDYQQTLIRSFAGIIINKLSADKIIR
jgi:hypothetical protein